MTRILILLVVFLGAWPAACADASSVIAVTVRYRESAVFPQGSALPVILEIVNTGDVPITLSLGYPQVPFRSLVLIDQSGAATISGGSFVGAAHAKLQPIHLAAHTALTVPVFLAASFRQAAPGDYRLKWRLDLTGSRQGIQSGMIRHSAGGELAITVRERDQPALDRRVAELVGRYAEIADGSASHHQERQEVVEEICNTEGSAAVAGLRTVLAAPVGMVEHGCRIAGALGQRWDDALARTMVKDLLHARYSSVVGAALAQYCRHGVIVDRETLATVLGADNPGTVWQALSYCERIISEPSPEAFACISDHEALPFTAIAAHASSQIEDLRNLARRAVARFEQRHTGDLPVDPLPPADPPVKEAADF